MRGHTGRLATQRIGSLMAIVALLAGALGPGAQPARAANPAPILESLDAPYVRTPQIMLGVRILPGSTTEGAVEMRVSNDGATTNGVLTNGVPVEAYGPWTLSPGPAGPRTVYGQIHYSGGGWSAISTLQLQADFTTPNRIHFDFDRTDFSPYQPGSPWDEVLESPDVPIIAVTRPEGSAAATDLTIWVEEWQLGFGMRSGSLTTGTFKVGPSTISPLPQAYLSVTRGNSTCIVIGSFTVRSIAVGPNGDLASLDAGYVGTCQSWSGLKIGGSIRYGSASGITALSQNSDHLLLGDGVVGSVSAPDTARFTNVGTVSTTLGAASLGGINPGDFVIDQDDCDGTVLAVGAWCEVIVRFAPTDRATRHATLVVPDSTNRGERRVRLSGTGYMPLELDLVATSVPAFGPASATFTITVTPPPSVSPVLVVPGGGQQIRSEQTLSNPTRRVYTITTTLPIGSYDVTANLEAADYLLGAADTVSVSVGTRTDLTLGLSTDYGVANGESATLVASLLTGGPLAGGTLRIRDGATNAILASKSVTGSNPNLSLAVTRPTGTHPFLAEFVPSAPTVRADSASYNLVVVTGTRPETAMATTTLYTHELSVQSPFTSPTGATQFECRTNAANWYPCTSPGSWPVSRSTGSISVRAVLPNGLKDATPAARPWIFDDISPVGTVSIANGATYTRTSTVALNVPATDNRVVRYVGLGNESSGWKRYAYSPTATWTLAAGDGVRTVWARWGDGAENWTYPPASDTIIVDATAPTATGPTSSFVAGGSLASGLFPATISWTGADATSGIARYELEQSTNGGAYASLGTAITKPSFARTLAPGANYRFRVRAVDRAGNVSAWAYGTTFTVSAAQQTSASITYTGTWSSTSSTSFWGGTAKYASTVGAKARITVTGRSFAWVAPVGPTRGSANVYVNGVFVKSVSLYAASGASQRVVFATTWSTSAARTIEIRVVGTAGHPRVDIDGFAWGS